MGKSLTVDFSAAPGDIEAGEYFATIASIQLRYGQETGDPYLNWRFDISDGPHLGQATFKITSLVPKALFTFRQFLKGLGYKDLPEQMDIDFDDNEPDPNLINPDLIGIGVKIKIAIRKGAPGYDDRAEVTKIIEAYGDGGQIVPGSGMTEELETPTGEIADAPWLIEATEDAVAVADESEEVTGATDIVGHFPDGDEDETEDGEEDEGEEVEAVVDTGKRQRRKTRVD